MSKRFIIPGLILISLLSLLPLSTGQVSNVSANDHDNNIYIGIYVLSIGNLEINKGSYILDFYIMFRWYNPDITPSSFEFINGRAVSKEKIYEHKDNNTCELWYRIQANLFITPSFDDYPFDTQDLKIIIEDSKYNISSIVYQQLNDVSGVDSQFNPPGWEINSYNIDIDEHTYPWSETYSRAVFTIRLSRATGPTAVKLLLPPIIFCIVSGLSFFFKADKITHRIGLGTSMLISAVMFHLSQTSSLPALPSLILIDKIMIAVYSFLASSLLATTLIYIDEEYWKDVDYTKIVNRVGAVITIILPFIVFSILYFYS